MRRYLFTVLLLLLIHLNCAAQFFSTRPFEAASAPTGSSFHDLLIAMKQDSTALYLDSSDSRSLALGADINFTYTYSNPSFTVDGGLWSAGHRFESGDSINFIHTPNFSAFEINGIVEIGYIGGTSSAGTELHVRAFADHSNPGVNSSQYMLYDLTGVSPDGADPYSVRLNPGSTRSYLQFGNGAGVSVNQNDPAYFKLFSGINPDGSLTGEYLFTVSAVDDGLSSGSELGIFYMVGDVSAVAVPEPASYCLFLSLILGIVLGHRRFRRHLS